MKTCLFAALALALIATAFAYPYQVIGESTNYSSFYNFWLG
jgi:hypothetical protein